MVSIMTAFSGYSGSYAGQPLYSKDCPSTDEGGNSNVSVKVAMFSDAFGKGDLASTAGQAHSTVFSIDGSPDSFPPSQPLAPPDLIQVHGSPVSPPDPPDTSAGPSWC